ncbi:hypothetical protein Bca52824_057901 [Brassica carinata]|uniref:Uncharacterized protein n=1 Tax=Brassica carinata TaxID=52824 RepID=A0A8X7UGM7_BRACI|nr:hypothetical protein Bca52824_057901 [Brassica carinata]
MVFKFHFYVPHLHIHHHHNHHHVPKGCVAIMVGHEGDEEGLHRFVVPLMFLSHPLFLSLLKEAEEKYGFKHAGPITIPAASMSLSMFRRLSTRRLIVVTVTDTTTTTTTTICHVSEDQLVWFGLI